MDVADFIYHSLKKNKLNQLIRFPISDGGDGFLDVCKENFELRISHGRIRSCYDNKFINIRAGFDKKSKQLFLEVADFIGLRTIPSKYRKPLELSSENFGGYLKKVVNKKFVKNKSLKIIVGIGGTGTNDLGLGLCKPFGLRLFDRTGNELEIKPVNFPFVDKMELPPKTAQRIDVVLDVNIPLFGKSGTSKIFAKQKGANSNEVAKLESGIKNILKVLKRDHHIDFTNMQIGAGGGISLGLMLLSNVRIMTSRNFLIERLKLEPKIKSADVVITGEGKFDEQSFMNKATGIVVTEALKRNKQVILIVGSNEMKQKDFKSKSLMIFELSSIFNSKEKAIKYYKRGINKIISTIYPDTRCSGNRFC